MGGQPTLLAALAALVVPSLTFEQHMEMPRSGCSDGHAPIRSWIRARTPWAAGPRIFQAAGTIVVNVS